MRADWVPWTCRYECVETSANASQTDPHVKELHHTFMVAMQVTGPLDMPTQCRGSLHGFAAVVSVPAQIAAPNPKSVRFCNRAAFGRPHGAMQTHTRRDAHLNAADRGQARELT